MWLGIPKRYNVRLLTLLLSELEFCAWCTTSSQNKKVIEVSGHRLEPWRPPGRNKPSKTWFGQWSISCKVIINTSIFVLNVQGKVTSLIIFFLRSQLQCLFNCIFVEVMKVDLGWFLATLTLRSWKKAIETLEREVAEIECIETMIWKGTPCREFAIDIYAKWASSYLRFTDSVPEKGVI